jgi:two-component system, OmpR family, phosphate regulon sensor histidine kinase PhoR
VRLAQRLLLGAFLVVSVLVVVAVALSGQRLGRQLRHLTTTQLGREARLVADRWGPLTAPDALADSAGAALGHRVTLVSRDGVVLGDSDFDGVALRALQNHNDRPEIVAARSGGVGQAERVSPSEGHEELYVAVAASDGRVARVSINTGELNSIVARARRDVLVSGIIALLIALGLAALFSRQITTPITELRDVAGAIAAGDLTRRPSLAAPAEVGELASAVRRMADQLESRMHALEAEDELLGALVEALNEGVIAVDRGRRVIRINRSGRQLLGVHAEVPFSVDLLPRDRTLHDALTDALAGGVVDRAETQIGARTLALTARPLGIGGAVLAAFDLTGLRKLQTVRRDFVANVSHELKTPLTAIRGFAETLAGELDSGDPHAQFAETIRVNAERMQRLVDDLLDLSRIESGGWTPSPVTVDIEKAAHDAASPCRDDMAVRGIAFVTDVQPDAHTVKADPLALRQALANLVENAVRYTTAGGTITVFAQRRDGSVAIGVRDTGSGIPAEHLPRVFERFYRVDPARSRAAGGTGLGLAIVKHLVEAHGGRVHAESTVGQGTTVTLLFPVAA